MLSEGVGSRDGAATRRLGDSEQFCLLANTLFHKRPRKDNCSRDCVDENNFTPENLDLEGGSLLLSQTQRPPHQCVRAPCSVGIPW